MKYVAALTDSKCRVERYFSKHRDNGPIPLSSFQGTFSDEAGFRLYTLYIDDRTFTKIEGTANFESAGERKCTETIYQAALKSAKAIRTPGQPSHYSLN